MLQNVETKLNGSILTITVDLSKRLGPSSTGKTTIIGTTGGSAKVPGQPEVSFGLNVYTKR